MVGSIMVVCVPTCAFLYPIGDLKPAQMNVQYNLIWELRLYKFELGHNATEATKNICHVKR